MVKPGVGAVVVEDVKLSRRDELAPVDSWLNGAQTSQNAHLLHVADDRRNVESLQLRVDRMQAADQVLEKELERLRQADELTPVDVERGDASSAVVNKSTCVVFGVARYGRRRVADRWHVAGTAVRRHLLGSGGGLVMMLVQQQGAVMGRVERDGSRRREAGRTVKRGGGGRCGHWRLQVMTRDAQTKSLQRTVHDRWHSAPSQLGRSTYALHYQFYVTSLDLLVEMLSSSQSHNSVPQQQKLVQMQSIGLRTSVWRCVGTTRQQRRSSTTSCRWDECHSLPALDDLLTFSARRRRSFQRSQGRGAVQTAVISTSARCQLPIRRRCWLLLLVRNVPGRRTDTTTPPAVRLSLVGRSRCSRPHVLGWAA